MTSPLLRTLPYASDSPLAVLLGIAADVVGPDDDEQREDAATAAAHHVYYAYASTLARVVDAIDWQGYPAATGDDRRHEPSAVAWLDGGAWLHHTLRITEQDGATDVLTLIVPCTCGHGYVDITLDTEDAMVEILTDLAPTHGRSPHLTDGPVDCGSVRAVPTLRQLCR
ncbi:hypothetical protein ABZV29_40930 [Streptomyces sp. NPDC005236]|uniref:hypothetical protein n=1 Tax=Streptomyces sp. NPDC005236 TaxID=3157028 RepID=UPI0033B437CC